MKRNDEDNKIITKELLEENGFELKLDCCEWANFYFKSICDEKFNIELSTLSNMPGREWNVHVDNKSFMSIGSCAVNTVGQFNDFMRLLEINYELH